MRSKAIIFLLSAFFIINNAKAQTVTLKQVGKVNIRLASGFAIQHNGFLYYIEHTGALYKTNLTTAENTRVGNIVFKNIKFFFKVASRLYTIETDGSMNQIDMLSGTSTVVSAIGTWSLVERVIDVGNYFYTIQNGVMYYHPTMNDKNRKQIGEAEFFNLGMICRTDTSLHSVIGGNLYQINTSTGKWTKIGPAKVWKSCKTFAVVNNKVYSVETPSSLYETSLPGGEKKQIDGTQFGNTRFIFADSGKLYELTTEGDLFEILTGS